MDDLHELVVLRSSDYPDAPPVFALFPDLEEYETRDLFSPHPELPDLWTHRGRRDDLVVLLNGEKTNPISFEAEITAHPDVRGALVAGNKRVEACLIVEPILEALQQVTKDTSAKENFVNNIWPTVEEANRHCPAHARIARSKILVLDPDMPMLRAAKGTIQRAGTLQLYAQQIEALYTESELLLPSDTPLSPEYVRSTLRSMMRDVIEWSDLYDELDFFHQGMDSLQLLRLSAAIRSRLCASISPSVMYRNPPITLLTTEICQDTTADVGQNQTVALQEMLQHYEEQIGRLTSEPAEPSPESNLPAKHTVILTGSTGTVGSFVLAQLLDNPEVAHIYCLNRSADSESLQRARNPQRGIHSTLDPDRVTFLTADLTRPSYGLENHAFQTLLSEATQIIHSAWPVDFNQPLPFFQPSLQGLVNLVAFARQAKHNPALLFLSSISAVSSATGLVSEDILPELTSPAPMGYGQSKYLAERIFAHAATTVPHLRLGVARIGQVSGRAQGPEGAWARTEWLPSLVISSYHLGALSDSLGGGRMETVDWVPVDELAVILVQLSKALSMGAGAMSVFNCVNPEVVVWQDLVPAIVEELSTPEKKLMIVSFNEWLTRLQTSAAKLDQGGVNMDEFFSQNPAVKLLEFYHQLFGDGGDKGRHGRLAVDKIVCESQTLAGLRPIQPEWMRRWIGEWIST
jgi:thioester reductase-like protein/aryl carrier-like protein